MNWSDVLLLHLLIICSLYIYTYRHEWVSETLYMRISTQNIACSQRQINTCHTSFNYILWAYGEHIMSKWSSRTSEQFIWLVSEKKAEAVNAYLIKNSKGEGGGWGEGDYNGRSRRNRQVPICLWCKVERRSTPPPKERENSNLKSKTLFYKDCSLSSFKNLSNN